MFGLLEIDSESSDDAVGISECKCPSSIGPSTALTSVLKIMTCNIRDSVVPVDGHSIDVDVHDSVVFPFQSFELSEVEPDVSQVSLDVSSVNEESALTTQSSTNP